MCACIYNHYLSLCNIYQSVLFESHQICFCVQSCNFFSSCRHCVFRVTCSAVAHFRGLLRCNGSSMVTLPQQCTSFVNSGDLVFALLCWSHQSHIQRRTSSAVSQHGARVFCMCVPTFMRPPSNFSSLVWMYTAWYHMFLTPLVLLRSEYLVDVWIWSVFLSSWYNRHGWLDIKKNTYLTVCGYASLAFQMSHNMHRYYAQLHLISTCGRGWNKRIWTCSCSLEGMHL